MTYHPINFSGKLSQFTDHWCPRIVAQMNDYHFKVVKIRGDFIWHSHPETDETFLVLHGSMRIDFRDGSVALKAGEMYVVPKGVEHKPFSEDECSMLLIEPAATVNTGDAGGERTVTEPEWI
jgi:mannose-6-phosphate isomerase-like protein (cupin superfamily)